MKRIRESEFFKLNIITTLACLLPIIFGMIVYSQLPEQVAIHFDGNNNPNGYAPKAVAVFAIPALMMVVQLVTCFFLELDVKKRNASRKMQILSRCILPVMSFVVQTIVILTALKRPIDGMLVMNLFMGVLFLIIGNLLPKCRYNYTIGIRVVTTLSSQENWNKTHRLAGFVWVIGAVVMIALTFLKAYMFAWVPMVFMVGIPIIYSVVYAISEKDKVKSE